MKKSAIFLLPVIFLLILDPVTIHSRTMSDQLNSSDSLKDGGIVFFKTTSLDTLHTFYTSRVGCSLWLDQGACKIFRHGNMLFGFCRGDEKDQQGVITFFYPSRQKVDEMYEKLESIAIEAPGMNHKFHIYHFYARDPEGRLIEFQYFDHPLKPY